MAENFESPQCHVPTLQGDEPTPPPQQKIILQPPVGMIFMTMHGTDCMHFRLE